MAWRAELCGAAPPLPQVSQQEGEAGGSPGIGRKAGNPLKQAPAFLPGLFSSACARRGFLWKGELGCGSCPQGTQPPTPAIPLTAADISPRALAFILIHLGFALPSQD